MTWGLLALSAVLAGLLGAAMWRAFRKGDAAAEAGAELVRLEAANKSMQRTLEELATDQQAERWRLEQQIDALTERAAAAERARVALARLINDLPSDPAVDAHFDGIADELRLVPETADD